MAPGRVLLLLAVAALGLAAEQRVVHRLVGGHLRAPPHHRAEPLANDDDAQEMVEASASGSKEKGGSKKGGEDEDKKTLSQQVAEGKYGLIQKELFSRPPKRPGIISYHDNAEVPKDNRHTLGGLSKNEIWLAENHLLVLRGGIYPPHDDKENAAVQLWPPIDDYRAPLHQVKIPKNPKVPPPFPVQLGEGAPLQIIGAGAEGAPDGAPPPQADAVPAAWLPAPQGVGQEAPQTTDTNQANSTAGAAALPVPGAPAQGGPPGGRPGGLPFPPAYAPLNGTWPPYFGSLPPGAAILPPLNGSLSEILDEDDPSIYYPPPYSFFYPADNSSKVPPGPLVPGIVVPPPPDFFAPLDEDTATKKPRQRKPTTPTTTQIRPTTTLAPQTGKPKKKKPPPTRYVPKTVKTTTTTTTERPTTVSRTYLPQPNRTYLPQRTEMPRKRPSVTILRPVKTTTASPKVYMYENDVNKQYGYYEQPRTKTVVTTTQVPLKYFTTGNEIESNSVTDVPEKFAIGIRVKSTTKPQPAQYYYYEEGTTTTTTTTKQPYFKEEDYFAPPRPPPPIRKPHTQYIYVTTRPRNTQKPRYRLVPQKSDSFSVHIAKLQKQIHQYYTTRGTTRRPSPKPLYQYSFEATNFRPSPQLDNADSFRPVPKYSVQIQQAIEIIPPTEAPGYQRSPTPAFHGGGYYSTPRPGYRGPQTNGYQATPRPIAQYSFEATPNTAYQGFYTKPDDHHFDENTKQYFTMFGRKLPSGTTPIPTSEDATPRPSTPGYHEQQYENYVNPQYEDVQRPKPISLEGDTIVNYANPRPEINPDAELIEPVNYPQAPQGQRANNVQYVRPQRPGDEENKPEIVKAIEIPARNSNDQAGSYISYQLPGDDGAHFYFLTPQLANSRNQGAPYYHQQGSNFRERRNQRSPSQGR